MSVSVPASCSAANAHRCAPGARTTDRLPPASRPWRPPCFVRIYSGSVPHTNQVNDRCRLQRRSQPASVSTVTIIGAGLGGIALVANLGLRGYRLRLHDRDPARIAKVRERGGLDVEGLAKGFAPLELGREPLARGVGGAGGTIPPPPSAGRSGRG